MPVNGINASPGFNPARYAKHIDPVCELTRDWVRAEFWGKDVRHGRSPLRHPLGRHSDTPAKNLIIRAYRTTLIAFLRQRRSNWISASGIGLSYGVPAARRAMNKVLLGRGRFTLHGTLRREGFYGRSFTPANWEK